ncbi:coiled-coil domain-containing glutamate-rich protein 1-like [Carassius auratus]|uniref:Coiled-coil domain-containing glutamate-rich protein 1-like n=1 Tax=Carassius auratus TaxID=7957 RepID=A0A6P6M576_CARAU|nr:coiled-coil domain-containing glutamate-rich protein 1-like [Carassius auratus]
MLDAEKMCGRGMMCQWEVYSNKPNSKETEKPKIESRRTNGGAKLKWHKWGRRPARRAHNPEMRRHRARLSRWSRTLVSLRPANIQGNRAPGMRAPRNTNQFLMHEKYQMMHMRSDSVGTDSGSDCEMDFADMDSYLGVLENARGALLDSPDLPPPLTFYARQMNQCKPFPFFSFDQEESMQYFPSEDDVMQSEDFMQRDFKEFCDTVAPCI